jgi:predicted DNA-binding protein
MTVKGKTTTIRVDKDLDLRWSREAARQNRHASDLMRDALAQYIDIHEDLSFSQLGRLRDMAEENQQTIGKAMLGMILTCLEASPSKP